MKRSSGATSTYNDDTEFVEIEVNMYRSRDDLAEAASVLDSNDLEFFDFEGSLLAVLAMHDFELEDAYQHNKPNRVIQYYILSKTNSEGTRLRMFVKLQVSEHAEADRTCPRQIDAILNDIPEHFQSYEKALRHIEDKLEEFDPEED